MPPPAFFSIAYAAATHLWKLGSVIIPATVTLSLPESTITLVIIMKRSNLNHVWLGLEVNGQKVTEIAYKRPYTYVTLESGEVLKNLATSSWNREVEK